jgi:hypothetical protein
LQAEGKPYISYRHNEFTFTCTLKHCGILKVKVTLVMSEYGVTKKKCYRLCLHSTESCATLAQTPVLFILSGQVNELYQKHPRPFQILQPNMTLVMISLLNEVPRERFATQIGPMYAPLMSPCVVMTVCDLLVCYSEHTVTSFRSREKK